VGVGPEPEEIITYKYVDGGHIVYILRMSFQLSSFTRMRGTISRFRVF